VSRVACRSKRFKANEALENSIQRAKEEEMYVELSNKLMNEKLWKIPDLYNYIDKCFESERRSLGAQVLGKWMDRFEFILKARDSSISPEYTNCRRAQNCSLGESNENPK
jgi:hypothetical protein